jgi:hypothetical protein
MDLGIGIDPAGVQAETFIKTPPDRAVFPCRIYHITGKTGRKGAAYSVQDTSVPDKGKTGVGKTAPWGIRKIKPKGIKPDFTGGCRMDHLNALFP